MNPPSTEVLLERVNAAIKAIDEHRQEARESSAEINTRLSELTALETRVLTVEKRTDDLHVTVHGTKDGPGLKGRQDRTERTVGVMVWAVAASALVLIAKALDWLSNLPNAKRP